MKLTVSNHRTSDGPLHTSKIRLDLQKAMQTDAAVFRYVLLCLTFDFELTYLRLTVPNRPLIKVSLMSERSSRPMTASASRTGA